MFDNKKATKKDKISAAFENKNLITRALALGVRAALIKHKRAGNPVVVWKNGKTVWLKPEEITVPEID